MWSRRSRSKEIRISRERERERQPNHSPTIPNSHQQENNDKIISGLEEESKQLRAKIKQLEQQLNNQQFSGNEKKIKESELDINRKLLEEREKELAKLRKSKPSHPTNTEKDNSKLNWAIGLGIVAVVIGLICLILMASRRKERS